MQFRRAIRLVTHERGLMRITNCDIVVRSLSRRATRGWLTLGGLRLSCALGRSGRLHRKAEGDGGTPIGTWRLRTVRYRADQGSRPTVGQLGLTVQPIRRDDGWCDARGDRNYNRAVQRPYPASSETLWRDDRVYDVIVILDHNELPRIQGAGSAIFMHVARPGLTPTAGCIALPEPQLRRVLAALKRGTRLHVVA
jgi:L,D-peptidoglycan transpeptidase YkuD (ErfK/YbiS/YcfS/YnhG family)